MENHGLNVHGPSRKNHNPAAESNGQARQQASPFFSARGKMLKRFSLSPCVLALPANWSKHGHRCPQDYRLFYRVSLKFGYSEKATKFEKIFHLKSDDTEQCQILSERFFQILWPSQNILTLWTTYLPPRSTLNMLVIFYWNFL